MKQEKFEEMIPSLYLVLKKNAKAKNSRQIYLLCSLWNASVEHIHLGETQACNPQKAQKATQTSLKLL